MAQALPTSLMSNLIFVNIPVLKKSFVLIMSRAGRSDGFGRSGGSLVATPDCKPTVLGLNPADSPAYSGLPVLRWAAIRDGNFTLGCPLRSADENINKKSLLVHQKQ
jgi:hypothetical protein